MSRQRSCPSNTLLALLSGLQLLGCSGKTVDVGHNSTGSTGPIFASSAPPAKGSSTAPFPVVSGEGDVISFVVDSSRLFWIASDHNHNYPEQRLTPQMRRCEIADCLDSVVSWPLPSTDTGTPDSLTSFGHRLEWRDFEGTALSSCDADDCTKQTLIDIGTDISLFAADSTGTVIVAPVGGMYSCVANDCQTGLSHLVPTAPSGESPFALSKTLPALDADYVYASDDRLVRFRRDGSAPFEVIASESAQVIVVQGDSVIWRNDADNTLKSCPKTGCSHPQVLVSGLQSSGEVVADAQFIYFTDRERLSRIPVAGGEAPTLLLEESYELQNLRVDEQNLYFTGTNCTASSDGDSHCTGISVIPQ